MPLTRFGCAACAIVLAATLIVPHAARAGGDFEFRVLHPHNRQMARLPPGVRHGDPAHRPPRRRGLGLALPSSLIQAYLPRPTERPIYNEPPSRFPQR